MIHNLSLGSVLGAGGDGVLYEISEIVEISEILEISEISKISKRVEISKIYI